MHSYEIRPFCLKSQPLSVLQIHNPHTQNHTSENHSQTEEAYSSIKTSTKDKDKDKRQRQRQKTKDKDKRQKTKDKRQRQKTKLCPFIVYEKIL